MKWNSILLGIAVGLVGGVFLFLNLNAKSDYSGTDEAHRIVEFCSKEEYPTFCYEKEIPKIIGRGRSMEEGFVLIKLIQKIDPRFVYCHIAAHGLAEREVEKDSSKWKEVALRAPLDECSAGALHGVFRASLRNGLPMSLQTVISDLATMCSSPLLSTVYTKNSCMHASGHLLMYAHKGSLADTYESCDALSLRTVGQLPAGLCYNGAGMQFFYPLEADDQVLVEGKRPALFKDGLSLCAVFSRKKYSTCVSEAVIGYHPERMSVSQTEEALLGCTIIGERNGRYACLWRGFAIFSTRIMGSEGGVEAFCRSFKSEYAEICFSASAARIIELDSGKAHESRALCERAEELGYGKECFESFSRAVAVVIGDKDSNALSLCGSLKEEYIPQCSAWVMQPPQGLIKFFK